MNSKTSYDELKLLITQAIEGSIAPEQMVRLNQILAASKSARQFYFEFIDIQILTEHLCSEQMFFQEKNGAFESEKTKHDMLLQALAQEEKEADIVQIEPSATSRPPVRPILEYRAEPRRISRLSVAATIMSAAALLFLVLFARYAPLKPGYEVATLTDSLHAEWADDQAITSGQRVAIRYRSMVLKSGIIQLLFDNNAQVVIEAPAAFNLVAPDQINLSYGRIFATVPREAIGFTVSSGETKVVDLGTEFGVDSRLDGGIELHVLKGKTLLFPENKSGPASLEVRAGAAKRISARQIVSDIPCNRRTFVRRIDSRRNLVWRGQKTLNMTDMVTGGDGETSHGMGKLDVQTGERTGLLFVSNPVPNPGFRASGGNPFIDGVFIPDRGDGQVISSTGLWFEQCPDTSGTAFYHISTLSEIPSLTGEEAYPLALPGGLNPTPTTLLLHPNVGITYDLAAIRDRNPGYQLTTFTTRFGFPASLHMKRDRASAGDNILSPEAASTEFYVLLDGRLCSTESIRMSSPPGQLRIPISDQDRFLTLVSTDGNRNTNFDWFVLEDPQLTLEEE